MKLRYLNDTLRMIQPPCRFRYFGYNIRHQTHEDSADKRAADKEHTRISNRTINPQAEEGQAGPIQRFLVDAVKMSGSRASPSSRCTLKQARIPEGTSLYQYKFLK
ncbi:hypothetical protein RF11_11471 [Thelohanellus kitauei]|uniref:Uncharacterized protein n=1 Tax=Thelohanellus kitauei TaxID=669202 RepID=A0A0C2NAT7_THEKT|nr:hypothetical protein RF11_11471 [Thelohanellus kitauei]